MPRKPASDKPKKKSANDLELDVMRKIWRIVAPFDVDRRKRMVAYLMDRCNDPVPVQASMEFEAGGRAE